MPSGNFLPSITTLPFSVTSANTDMYKHLRTGALADLLIQSAIKSADELQAGFDVLKQQKLVWVLSRLTIKTELPMMWYQTGEIETWPKNIEKIIYLRDFFVKDENQQLIARATSGWLAIDMTTRRPRTFAKDGITELFTQLKNRQAITTLPEKLFPVKEGHQSEVNTTYFDIDLNGHVTSSRYLDWMTDTFTPDFHRNNYPKEISVNYLNETLINETIRLTRKTIGSKIFLFEGFNTTRNIIAFLGKISF